MKTISTTLFSLLSWSALAQEPLTYRAFGKSVTSTVHEGVRRVAVLDHTKATLTVGTVQASGAMSWDPPLPTGLDEPKILSSLPNSLDVIVGSEISNRLTFITPGSGAGEHLYPGGPGPTGVAPFFIDRDAAAELLVASTGEGGLILEALTAGGTTLGTQSQRFPVSRVWPMRLSNDTAQVSFLGMMSPNEFIVGEAGLDVFSDPHAFSVVGNGMTYGFYDGSSRARVIVFQTGDRSATSAQISQNLQSWDTLSSLSFPRAIECLVTNESQRLGVLYQDGSAQLFDYDGAELSAGAMLPGQHDLLVSLGNDEFLTLSDDSWTRWRGNDGAELGSGLFPRRRLVSNVLFVSGRPFVDPDAVLVQAGRSGDWTVGASASGGSWSIVSLTQSGQGLGNATGESLPSPGGVGGVLVNQFLPEASFSVLGGAAGVGTPQVFINPGSGTYEGAINVIFSTTLADARVYYRRSQNDAWMEYEETDSLSISTSTEFYAYAENSAQRSPTRRVKYEIGVSQTLSLGASVDADQNGLSDQWEDAFQVFDPQGDADGDGENNLAEFQNGTDPRDPSSFLPPGQDSLTAQGDADGVIIRWPVSLGDELQESPDLQSWEQITEGIVQRGNVYEYRVTEPQKSFYRLRP